ncbi:M48 family metallopeptidase [Candidatus Saccharibacteria bacterium]|nr:M48 family metallopeptidase [Candidatus Saccharibacteria bacterium]
MGKSKQSLTELRLDRREYLDNREMARMIIQGRLDYYQTMLGVKYKRVSIKLLRSRWGSCSSLGNLNFNYLIIKLPDQLRDSVIVHELTHLIHPNHSQLFYQTAEEILPGFRKISKQMRNYQLRG